MYDINALNIDIDGSARKNPGADVGFAIIGEYPARLESKSGLIMKKRYTAGTNNTMELGACIATLDWIKKKEGELKSDGITRIVIYTDADYVFGNQYKVYKWRKNKGYKDDGTPVENWKHWKKFISKRGAIKGLVVDIQWKRGKSDASSKEVDKLAKQAARKAVKNVDYDYQSGSVAPSLVDTPGVAEKFPARGQEATIHVYAKRYSGNNEYRIRFNFYEGAKKIFVRKYFAFVFKEELSLLHKRHCHRVRFNDSLKHPRIESVARDFGTVKKFMHGE